MSSKDVLNNNRFNQIPFQFVKKLFKYSLTLRKSMIKNTNEFVYQSCQRKMSCVRPYQISYDWFPMQKQARVIFYANDSKLERCQMFSHVGVLTVVRIQHLVPPTGDACTLVLVRKFYMLMKDYAHMFQTYRVIPRPGSWYQGSLPSHPEGVAGGNIFSFAL